VTVVEWGEGKVEGLAEDRLLVAIERATGDGAGIGADVEDHDPRTVRFDAVGPRWAGVDLTALAEVC
jgi:tRNA threonylcarbamoyladenosine biosynthesis protein TsaE